MAEHNELGQQGERLAVNWLKKNGFDILHQNWRHSYHEIDIIALKNNLLHIIEVKTRTTNDMGYPEESVSKKKFRHLQHAADEFLNQHKHFRNIQFDILAITTPKDKEPEFFLIEDVSF
jgi:putative endonuclease